MLGQGAKGLLAGIIIGSIVMILPFPAFVNIALGSIACFAYLMWGGIFILVSEIFGKGIEQEDVLLSLKAYYWQTLPEVKREVEKRLCFRFYQCARYTYVWRHILDLENEGVIESRVREPHEVSWGPRGAAFEYRRKF